MRVKFKNRDKICDKHGITKSLFYTMDTVVMEFCEHLFFFLEKSKYKKEANDLLLTLIFDHFI